MHRTTISYYNILEVDSDVSQESIEAAYHRLARRYHPDLNRNKDSKSKMQELNEAYQVLRDPRKRDSYDKHLNSLTKAEYSQTETKNSTDAHWHTSNRYAQASAPSPKSYTGHSNIFSGTTDSMPTTCEQCGRSDISLRYATFPYVISVILVSFRRGESGLYCSKCRSRKMNTAKLASFVFGWWGIPFGIVYTLRALFAPSEGILDAKRNADYLRWLGGYFIRNGRLADAQRVIKSSLDFKHDPELAATADAIFGNTVMLRNGGVKKTSNTTWIAVIIISIMAILIGIAVTNILKDPRQRISTALISQQTFSMNKPQPPSSTLNIPLYEDWTHFRSKQGILEIEYPSNWIIDGDTHQAVELDGLALGVILMWSTNETDKSITDIIANSTASPNFADNYFSSLRNFLEGELKNKGGSVEKIDRPIIKQIGEYYTIYNEVTTSYTSVSGTIKYNHLIHYIFDCGSYVCRMSFYKNGDDPFTVEQLQLAEQILASIKMVPPIPTPRASSIYPPQPTDSSSAFSSLSFCSANEFRNANIPKRWYFNGENFLDNTSSKEYTTIEEATHPSLRPG